MELEAWKENWQERFRSLIQRMGYGNTFEFVMSRRMEVFGQMYRAIRQAGGENESNFLAFAHLKEMFYIDAAQNGYLREAFMEAFVRSFQQFFRLGWNRGKRVRERRISVEMEWPVPTPALVPGLPYSFDELHGFQSQIWEELERLNPPDDWCPEDFNDPIVQEAFVHIWPPENMPDKKTSDKIL